MVKLINRLNHYCQTGKINLKKYNYLRLLYIILFFWYNIFILFIFVTFGYSFFYNLDDNMSVQIPSL